MPSQSMSLSQEQRQLQILAPQLRQSLELLQVPLLELRARVQQELERNPTLEQKPEKTEPLEAEPVGSVAEDAKELNFKKEFEILARLDEESCRYFMQDFASEPYDAARERRRAHVLESQVRPESLQEHLARQLRVAGLPERERRIGELLIGSINEDGYLLQSVEDLAAATGFEPARIQDVLGVIQEFDPIGVGARTLAECLRLQLERLGQGDSLAAAIVAGHLEALGRRQVKDIARALDAPPEAVQQAARLIATLEPKPGRAFSAELPRYVQPDATVEPAEGGYVVRVHNEQVPRLWISRQYRAMFENPATPPETKDYLRERIRAGLILIRSLSQRQQTLQRVADAIVRVQTDFFAAGVAALKPLTMADIARQVGLHETTVCRCVANKYLQTPQGLFELKYFFTPGLRRADGTVVSNKTVQDRLAALIAAEDPAHPLSDQDLMERFRAEGLTVARRTVAKYRLALKIPPSHLRRAG